MNRYILLSNRAVGFLELGYDQDGYLCFFENCTWGLKNEVKEYLLRELRFMLTESSLITWVNDNGRELVKVEYDISFERFWSEYDKALDRLRCVKEWNKLSDAKKTYVFMNLRAYKRYLNKNPWLTQLYPYTYLLDGHWMDEWDKIKAIKK